MPPPSGAGNLWRNPLDAEIEGGNAPADWDASVAGIWPGYRPP